MGGVAARDIDNGRIFDTHGSQVKYTRLWSYEGSNLRLKPRPLNLVVFAARETDDDRQAEDGRARRAFSIIVNVC